MAKEPSMKFRLGAVTANIWENEGPNKIFYTVDLRRSYKDADGSYKNTSSLNHGDLMNTVRVLQKAETWTSAKI